MSKRLDAALVERGLAGGRDRAKEWISGGLVSVNGSVIQKPAYSVSDDDEVTVQHDRPVYVGRGGEKLEGALTRFGLDVHGLVCLDIGASTGGFTDCLLRHGAQRVYAVDVGRDQLAPVLRADGRVVCMDQTDIRGLTPEAFSLPPMLAVCDVSFISLRLILPAIRRLLSPEGAAVVLVKPQFECGRAALNKKGIVRDPAVHRQVLRDVLGFAAENGLYPQRLAPSPIAGGDGNREYLLLLGGTPAQMPPDAERAVRETFHKE